MSAGENYQRIAAHVAQAARENGRDPSEVRLIAVSKTVGVPEVADAFACGARDFGENRPECLVEKATANPAATWHFIGNIQSRKIRDIVSHASLIHSLFTKRHAEKIDEAACSLGKVQDVLVEVNVSGEESKGGCTPQEAKELVAFCCGLENVRVRGLMTMAPQGDEDEIVRTFKGLKELQVEIKSQLEAADAACFDELSMGMSEDWPEAVAQGATMVRVGRAIFSDSFE